MIGSLLLFFEEFLFMISIQLLIYILQRFFKIQQMFFANLKYRRGIIYMIRVRTLLKHAIAPLAVSL